MKRMNNLYSKICNIENIRLADDIARKGKLKQYGIKLHDKNREANLLELQERLVNKTYRTSPYTVFVVYEPKEREIYRLPYIDRVAQHAIMNILEPIFVANFTADTYSCIKGRGIHKASKCIKRALKDRTNTAYCLKFDIVKFYPSIDNEILKQLLRKIIKDRDLLWLLDGIIDSAKGLPIGNYLSQYLANFYLSYFDHWVKEEKQVRYYSRYADDIVILSSDKTYLHGLLKEIRAYLSANLNLAIKENHQVFPVVDRGIDFVGYKHFHTHTLLRKSIKKSFARAIAKNKAWSSIASYNGWAKHADSKNLIKKLLPDEKIQRLRDQGRDGRVRRRPDQNNKGVEPGNNRTGLLHQGVKVQGRLPVHADRMERDKILVVDRVQRTDQRH